MYFKEKENTSIDAELQEKKGFDIQKYKPLIVILAGVIVLFVIIFIMFSLRKPSPVEQQLTYNIELNGDRDVIITLGNDYIELGYNAYDSDGNNLTNEVKVSSNININEVGNYEISYTIGDKTVIRSVEIKKQAEETYIYLKGNKNIYLDLFETYTEPGCVAHDTIDGDVTEKIKITGKVNNKKKGLYKIVYTYTNSREITTQVIAIFLDFFISVSFLTAINLIRIWGIPK